MIPNKAHQERDLSWLKPGLLHAAKQTMLTTRPCIVQVTQAVQAFLSAATNKAAGPQSETADPVQPASIHHHAGTLFHACCAWPPITPVPLDPPTWALSQSDSHTVEGSRLLGIGTTMASQAVQAGGLSGVASSQSPAFHAPGVDSALRPDVLPAGNPAKRQKTGVTGSSGPLGVPIKAVIETTGARHDAGVDALRVCCLLVDTRSMQVRMP